MGKRFTSTVAGASVFLALIAILSRGVGFIREIIFASFFGLSEEFDIYLIGAALPLTIDVIIFYIGQNYFIPALNNYQNKKSEQIAAFVRFNLWSFSIISIVVSLVLFSFSHQIVSFYLGDTSSDVVTKTNNIFRIFLITIPFAAAISILTAYLQSKFNFTSPGFSRLFLNISIIGITVLFAEKLGIYVIPIGHLVGTILQFIYLQKKSNIKLFGNIIPLSEFNFLLKNAFFYTIVVESISQLYIITDRYFVSSVDQGGIAALNYSQILFQLPISIVSLALSTALLSKLSKTYAEGSFDDLQSTYNDGIRINVFIFVPITLIYFFFGHDLIKLTFERGNFNAADSLMTFNTLKYLSLSFVFYSAYSISNKMLYSTNLIKALMVITIVGITIKLSMNFILVEQFQQDGLAISTAVSYIFFFIASLLILKIKNIVKENIFFQEVFYQSVNVLFTFYAVKIFFATNIIKSGLLEITLFIVIYFINNFLQETRAYFLIKFMILRYFKIS